ncbi:MAG: helix-turn-helix transcriptional regulator [Lachnospiraceae bacterium]|nr:helix-turn-helix transcriptional regulator [Lachnospiraceae bacterium]
MLHYITHSDLQYQFKKYYERTGRGLQFPEMMEYLHKHNLLSDTISSPDLTKIDSDLMSDDEFESLLDSIPLSWSPTTQSAIIAVEENNFFPSVNDVFAIRHPRYTRLQMHRHNFFEIAFVAKGNVRFLFEKEEHLLPEGSFCIIAPSSLHDFFVADDDSVLYTISIRQSTFNTTFFPLLSKPDLLSSFFRTILQKKDSSNYLLFFTKNPTELKRYFRHILLETNIDDDYNGLRLIQHVYLLFSSLMRHNKSYVQFYSEQASPEFALILQYIQHNYRTVSLSFLADFFHYSEPHLCTLIKQNTGSNFSDLIRQLKLAHAIDYLINTNLRISEIAETIGYNSADHFSRVFREQYQMSPQKYRKEYQMTVHHDTLF